MPTNRQFIAVKKLAELSRKSKGKNITIGRILREAGYTQSVSESPTKVTESKGFKELIAEMAPDSEMAKQQKKLLHANEMDSYRMPSTMTDKEIETEVEALEGFRVRKILRIKGEPTVQVLFWRPDSMTIDRALDKLYKIKGYYSAEKHEVGGSIEVIEINNYGTGKK